MYAYIIPQNHDTKYLIPFGSLPCNSPLLRENKSYRKGLGVRGLTPFAASPTPLMVENVGKSRAKMRQYWQGVHQEIPMVAQTEIRDYTLFNPTRYVVYKELENT